MTDLEKALDKLDEHDKMVIMEEITLLKQEIKTLRKDVQELERELDVSEGRFRPSRYNDDEEF